MPESRSRAPLVWIDCEMTGLDYEKDVILSIACFVTDAQLQLLDEQGFEVTVHHEPAVMEQMGEWCTQQHGHSGLTQAVLDSTTTPEEAAQALLAYVQKYCPERKKALLAGNTVHADRAFLRREPYKPVTSWLHHRILDVSAIKEAMKRWSSDEVIKGSPKKKGLHEARQDILESIAEARYYREKLFLPREPAADARAA